MRACVPLSVYDTVKYFTETVTPRLFSKIILSRSIIPYSSFSKHFLLFVPALGHVEIKNFIEY